MYKFLAVLAFLTSFFLSGCSTSKISALPITGEPTQEVKVIAFMPGSGLVADAVGVELSNRGFTIIDSTTVSSMMVRLNLNEIEITRPEGLAKLRAQGIDATLVVRSSSSNDNLPDSASARMNSTENGKVIAGVTWQNGYGCQAGSPCDRVMRKGLTEMASEIAEALSKRIKK